MRPAPGRIEEIRGELRAGVYRVDPELVAAAMLARGLLRWAGHPADRSEAHGQRLGRRNRRRTSTSDGRPAVNAFHHPDHPQRKDRR